MSNFEKLFPKFPHSSTSRVEIKKQLQYFSAVMPELTLKDTGSELKLEFPEAEDFSMEIHGDYDMHLGTIFRGVFTTYCPTEHTFTEWFDDVQGAVKALAKHYQRNYVKRPEKSKRKFKNDLESKNDRNRKDDDAPRGIRKRKG